MFKSQGKKLWEACRDGKVEEVQKLIQNPQFNINWQELWDKSTPFYNACRKGYIEIVKLLVNDDRVDINQAKWDGLTPFYAACKYGHIEIVKLLLNDKRVDFNQANEAPLAIFWAIEKLSLNDEITRIFKDIGGMDILANSFIQSTKDTQKTLLSPTTNIVSHNQLFREYLGKNSEFLNSLTILLNETQDIASKLRVAGILLSLAGYISNKEIVKTVLENIIFPTVRNNQSSQKSMNIAMDCLMESSAIDSSKSILLGFGTKEIIQPFVDNQNSEYHFLSCIIQAFLSSNDVNQNNEFGSNPASPKVISKILDVVNTFIITEAQQYVYNKEGYLINCYNILKALGSLARNEANMKELKNNGIVKKIIEFITNRKDNLLKTSERTIEELSTLIWNLSFDKDCKNEFLSNGIVEILKGFNIKDNESVKRAVDGALFILIGNQNQNQNRNEIKGQVMISYCWEEKEKARGIANFLQSKNIPIWIDIEQMEGSVLEKMAEAVEESSVILVFLSSKYKESQACRTEAEYAYKLKKEVICIMAEENYQPRGWLGALLGNKIWYNLWKDMIFIEELFLPILSQLVKLLDKPEALDQAQEQKQDQNPKPIQVTRQPTINSQSQSTSNDHQNQQQQQILSLLEKILTKIDGFENRLQKVEENFETVKQKFDQAEAQTKGNFETPEQFEKLEQRIGKMEQSLEKLDQRFEKMESNSEQRFEQMLEKLEKNKTSLENKQESQLIC